MLVTMVYKIHTILFSLLLFSVATFAQRTDQTAAYRNIVGDNYVRIVLLVDVVQ